MGAVMLMVLAFANVGLTTRCGTGEEACNYGAVWGITLAAPVVLVAVGALVGRTRLPAARQVLVIATVAVVMVLCYWFLLPATSLIP